MGLGVSEVQRKAGRRGLWLTLLVCLRVCGVGGGEVPWQESLAAFAFVRLLTALVGDGEQ